MEKTYKDFSGVILAGGRSSRMGFPKQFLEVNGKKMIDIAVDVFRPLFDEIVIIVDDKSRFRGFTDVIITEDLVKGCGPLGGIYTGLETISCQSAFFIACDMPFLHNGLIRRQLERFSELSCEALVPKTGELIEPLHAIYTKTLANKMGDYIKRGNALSIRRFLQEAHCSYFDLEDDTTHSRMFRNINTPHDLEEVRRYESKVKSLA